MVIGIFVFALEARGSLRIILPLFLLLLIFKYFMLMEVPLPLSTP